MTYTKLPTIASLSDLDHKTALAALTAMEYSDIIHLSYRQAIRLWIPLSKTEWYVKTLRSYLDRKLDPHTLSFCLEHLEDYWLEHHCKGYSNVYPPILDNEVWRKQIYQMGVATLPDFIYSEDGTDLQWVGANN